MRRRPAAFNFDKESPPDCNYHILKTIYEPESLIKPSRTSLTCFTFVLLATRLKVSHDITLQTAPKAADESKAGKRRTGTEEKVPISDCCTSDLLWTVGRSRVMTKLLEYLTLASALLSVWSALLFSGLVQLGPEVRLHVLLSPVYAVALFGLISFVIVVYRTATFNDCPEAAEELKRQIQEARQDLTSKGFKFPPTRQQN